MQIRFDRAHDSRVWDVLVAASPGATSFHDWSWLALQSEIFGWKFEPLIVSDGARPIGVFPVLLKPSPLPRAAEPPFPFVGPLVPDGMLAATLHAFRRWQVLHGMPFVRFDFGPMVADVARDTLPKTRCEWKADRTIMIDLVDSSPEKLIASMKKGARYSLRAAGRNRVRVRPSLPGELTTLLPQILDESYGSRDVPSPYPTEIGRKVEDWAEGRDDVYVGTALVDECPAGVLVALGSHPVVTGWAGGSLRAYRAANTSTILYHDMLEWSLRRGHSSVDLVGFVDEGVSRFKFSLGGVEKPYITVVSSHLPALVLSAAAALRKRRDDLQPSVHPATFSAVPEKSAGSARE